MHSYQSPDTDIQHHLARRVFLGRAACGIGSAALATLLGGSEGRAAEARTLEGRFDDAARLLDVLCGVWTRTRDPGVERWARGLLDFVLAMQGEVGRCGVAVDTLAEMKARKVAEKHSDALVLGCDQVLALDRQTFAKPETPDQARAQLRQLRGQSHKLLSAIVAYENAEPVWRHVAEARLTMHAISDSYLDDYITRTWDSIRHSVGCYKIEEEGVRLFSAISGDHFTILGLPLLPLLAWAGTRGMIAR